MIKAKRYISAQLLHRNLVFMAGFMHELWRVGNVEKAGLTDKERAYLMKRHEAIQVQLDELAKLQRHLVKA